MPKIRKQKRKKTFRHTVNRKKLNKKKRRLPKIKCDAVKEAWDVTMSVKQNLLEMGLSTDPNVTLAIPKTKALLMPPEPETEEQSENLPNSRFPRLAVAHQLERESKVRKQKTLRLSQMIVDRLGYFIEKYGEDYKAMTRDRLNYDQHTWRQLRSQIKKFMSIPEQWNAYWASSDKQPPQRCVVLDEDENMEDP